MSCCRSLAERCCCLDPPLWVACPERCTAGGCRSLRAAQWGHSRLVLRDWGSVMQAMRAGIVHDLEKVEGQLDAEAKEDEEARQHYGEREWPLQPASVCTANLRDRIAGYKWVVLPAKCHSSRRVCCPQWKGTSRQPLVSRSSRRLFAWCARFFVRPCTPGNSRGPVAKSAGNPLQAAVCCPGGAGYACTGAASQYRTPHDYVD